MNNNTDDMAIERPFILSQYQWPLRYAKFSSIFAIILGACSTLGWSFAQWLPDELLPFVLAIKPNTALCFIYAGMALWVSCEMTKIYHLYFVKLCATLILIVSVLSLAEYALNRDFGIDRHLFKNAITNEELFLPPGRMSPLSAINFTFISFSLLFINNKIVSYRVNQFFIMLALVLTYFIFLGNIYDIINLAQIFGLRNQYIQAGLPIIIAFFILELGVLFINPDKGLAYILTSKTTGGRLARRLIPPGIILPIILGYIELNIHPGGSYNPALGTSLLILSITLLFLAFILVNAYFFNESDNERNKMDEALHLNQEKLQAILTHTNAVMYMLDIKKRFILANRQFEKLFHKKSTEIIGNNIYSLLPKKLADEFEQNNSRVIQSRKSIEVEEHIPDKDKIHTFLVNKFPLFNETGHIIAVGGIATDITNIKEMQEVLRENQERFTLALKSAKAGTWSWDIINGSIVWDEYMYKLFDVHPNDFQGTITFLMSLIHPDDRERVDHEIQNALKNNLELENEFRVLHSDGTVKYLASRGKIYRDDHENTIRIMGVCWDISQHKHAEEELKLAKETAEYLAKKAEEASKAKSAFLAAMSHEIRTPLNGVLGITELLLETPLNDLQKKYIETGIVSGKALLTIINDILDFSKIESGRMELESIDFDLQELIDDTVEIIAVQIGKKEISIDVLIDYNVPTWLKGDPSRVRQVLHNLLSNAVKFTEKGKITIYIKLAEINDNNVKLIFEVTDTGVGITPDIYQRLFKPFSQGDISTSRKHGGTGLGLIISKRLVEIMGGQIDVESVPDKGSKFWFNIKLQLGQPDEKNVSYSSTELKGVRILCVDNNLINRNTIKRQTESWQMRCDLAANAAEALSKMQKAIDENDSYKLLLVDYYLPGMSGIELIGVIRKLKEIAETKIIILASFDAVFGLNEMNNLGIMTSISKPLKKVKLHEAIIAALTNENIKAINKHPDINVNSTERLPTKNERILVAEDNEINQQLILQILKRLGYQTDTVSNGIELLEAIKKTNYDLILMDCQMPEMDGYTATREIRTLEKNSNQHIPIIAITAYALKGDYKKCIDSGMNDYLSKPVEIKLLVEKINRWLGKKKIINQPPIQTEQKLFIDIARIKEIFGDNQQEIDDFMKSLVTTFTALLAEVNKAIITKDRQNLQILLHRLKGSAGNSGIMQLHSLFAAAEIDVKNNDWESLEKNYQIILDLFAKIRSEIEHHHYSDKQQN